MCFSATASFTAGLGLLALGIAAAQRARSAAELPFALVPALFGAQQLVEGALWLTLAQDAPLLSTCLTQTYSAFSQILWPVYIPVAVLLIEVVPWRRTAMATFAAAGVAVAIFLGVAMARQPVIAELHDKHISYVFEHGRVATATALYLLGVCVSPLLSSHRIVRLFGVMASLSLVGAYAFYANWFISVWCFFAAALSSVVLLHFTHGPVRPLEAST